MDLQQYLQALRKFWWVILCTTLLGAIYGGYSVSKAESEYRASVTFFVVTESADTSASAAVQGDQFAQRRVNSYVALLSTERLATMIAARDTVDASAATVRRMMGASGDLDTVLLTATATSPSESLAQAVGDAVAEDFVRLVDDIEGGPDGPASVKLEVVSGPSVRELAPRVPLMVGVPAFWGLLIGLAAAVLLELRDNSVRSDDQLLSITSVPVLGSIPEDRRALTTPLIVDVDGMSAFAEAFRQLRTNLQFLDIERPVQVVVVTSSLAEEGKSVTSANLALSLTVAGYDTLVIEADLRRPRLADMFKIDRSIGLTDVLVGRYDIDRAIQKWGPGPLSILPSGPLAPNPSELLGSEVMGKLLGDLRNRFDVIVIDTPPLLPVTDAAVASAHADGILLAVRSGHTTRQQISSSVRSLRGIGAPLLGTVMTMTATTRGSDYRMYGVVDGAGVRARDRPMAQPDIGQAPMRYKPIAPPHARSEPGRAEGSNAVPNHAKPESGPDAKPDAEPEATRSAPVDPT